ncbi:MAG: lysylphosphatidylglycerol synthase transmembrane domain-containing protein [Candidatus Kapaibacterium sp.]|jgi:uncharacterized protein (TIRG00374 family)
MTEKLKSISRVVLGLALMVMCVYWSLKNVDLEKMWNILQNANYVWALLCIPIALSSHWLRAVRWKAMLESSAKTKLIDLFSAVMVGYAVNNFTPKGGELLRPYVLSRRENIPFSTVMATIILERLFFDMAALILIFCWALLALPKQLSAVYPEFSSSSLVSALGVPFILVLVYLIVSSVFPQVVDIFLQKTIKRFSHSLYNRLRSINQSFEKGFVIVRTPSQIIRTLLDSAGIWLCYILPSYIMLFAFDFPPHVTLGFKDAMLLFVVGSLAYVSPAPGALGVYHTLVSTAMAQLYGISTEQGLAYATMVHGVNYVVTIIGGISLVRESKYISFKRSEKNNTNTISS